MSKIDYKNGGRNKFCKYKLVYFYFIMFLKYDCMKLIIIKTKYVRMNFNFLYVQGAKKKRVRMNPVKKWTNAEEILILNYLKDTILEGKEIDKPTSRIYYDKMCGAVEGLSGISFDIIRNKTKNMKNAYIKAVKWRDQTGQGVENDATIRDHILRICPHFDLLDEIFSDRPSINVPYVRDSGIEAVIGSPERSDLGDMSLDDMIEVEFVPPDDEYSTELQDSTSISIETRAVTSGQDSVRRQRKVTPRKPRYTQNSMVQITELQKSRNEHSNKKISIEKEKLKLQDKWEEKKLEIEREKIKSQERLKKIELEHLERMRRIELEKEERIARFELELKYNAQ